MTTTETDSLARVYTVNNGVGSFKVFNGASYRTATTAGNIFPYDDFIELDPGVTVHLPAPTAGLAGKQYTIIAGGGTGGGGPGSEGTVDVVDGSSTIELSPSILLVSPFESYTLVCNGSLWIIINNKP